MQPPLQAAHQSSNFHKKAPLSNSRGLTGVQSSDSVPGVSRPLSIAPMMAYSDRHFRYFMRQLTRHALLYTEMLTTGAILHGDREYLLGFSPEEHPIALQIGGDDPTALAQCAEIAQAWGYNEVNLNVGCPSQRVQSGNFGACLMTTPDIVARGVAAMRAAVDIPVTVKHRIGVDDQDSYEDLRRFVETVAEAGCQHFTVHARKAWLSGLSPKENRTIPPLRYPDVYRLKREFPELTIEINGGIKEMPAAQQHLREVDAVMIGRAAIENPYAFAAADRVLFGDLSRATPSRAELVTAMIPYAESWTAKGLRLHKISRHLLPLFAGRPGTRAWKRYISEQSTKPGAGAEVLQEAMAQVPDATLCERPAEDPDTQLTAKKSTSL